MLKEKLFKEKASRDISASRNLRLRRLKHRKSKTIPTPCITISDSRYLKRANIMFALSIIHYPLFSKESFKRSSARRDSPLC